VLSDVLDIIIADISFSKRISDINSICFKSMSGEILTTIGILVLSSFFFSLIDF